MANSFLEQLRLRHEDVERYQQAAVDELKEKGKTYRDALYKEHRIKTLLEMASDVAKQLLRLEEKDMRQLDAEVASLSHDNSAKVLSMFYTRLSEIRDFFRKNPSSSLTDVNLDIRHLMNEVPVQFSGEERLGRNVDLSRLHQEFINLAGVVKVDYFTYLSTFTNFADIPLFVKTEAYYFYLSNLLEYLQDFHERTKPLEQLEEILDRETEDVLAKWDSKSLLGWHVQPDKEEAASYTPEGAKIRLDEFESPEELVPFGMDVLKEELQIRGLKCGGRLEDRISRLWATKGLAEEDIDPALKAGTKSRKGRKESALTDLRKQMAVLEAKINVYADQLSDRIQNARMHVERKHVRTYSEMEAENEDEEELEEELEDEEDKEDDGVIYNPKNLPLDATGRPIPYWLYKLHGLNVEFKCEICGNQVYRGPRNFERHFQEWRHQYGMRCLRIPNTRHFHGVTKISEALALYNRLKTKASQEVFNSQEEEEFEDAEGNVMPRRTYELMKKQGLLRT